MADAITPITFGGVKLNENEIAKKAEVPGSAYGENDYVVNFKSGATLVYPNQPARNKAQVTSHEKPGSVAETKVQGLNGGLLRGSETSSDAVELINCKQVNTIFTNKDVISYPQTDRIKIDNEQPGNRVSLAEGDIATINGQNFTGPGRLNLQ
ncbi:MAG: hypothetical protein WCG95_03835 [bacterium]